MTEMRRALEALWQEVFGGDELGAEPNVYADYDRLTELKRMTRAALQSVPDGGEAYVLVPREPTELMAQRGLEELQTHLGHTAVILRDPVFCYRAMIAASPELAAAPPPDGSPELDEALSRIEDLEREAESVSAEFERDLSIVMRQLLEECSFDFDGDPWTADTAYQHIHDTLEDQERRLAAAPPDGSPEVEDDLDPAVIAEIQKRADKVIGDKTLVPIDAPPHGSQETGAEPYVPTLQQVVDQLHIKGWTATLASLGQVVKELRAARPTPSDPAPTEALHAGAEMPTIEATIHFVDELFAGVTDKAGEPYREHCIRVMQGLPADATEAEKHAALLHDVFEDTSFGGFGLIDLGYPDEVVSLVHDLTKRDDETYGDYIKRVARSPATRIKRADLADNSNPERLAKLPQETSERLGRKYLGALIMLNEASPTPPVAPQGEKI